MKTEKYYEKNGVVYGVSVKDAFGRLTGYVAKFKTLEGFETWLHREEYDFRERSYCSKSEAIREWGYTEEELDAMEFWEDIEAELDEYYS